MRPTTARSAAIFALEYLGKAKIASDNATVRRHFFQAGVQLGQGIQLATEKETPAFRKASTILEEAIATHAVKQVAHGVFQHVKDTLRDVLE